MLFKTIAFVALSLASASSAFELDLHERHADLEERNGGGYGAGGRNGGGKGAEGEEH